MTGETRFRRREGIRKVDVNIEEHATNPPPQPRPRKGSGNTCGCHGGWELVGCLGGMGVWEKWTYYTVVSHETGALLKEYYRVQHLAYSVLARFEDIVTG